MKNRLGSEHSRRSRILPVLFALCIAVSLLGCSPRSAGERQLRCDELLTEPASCTALLPEGYSPTAGQTDELFSAVIRGDAAVCFDIQARGALEQGFASCWYPSAEAAVVLAVDQSRTDAPIEGWADLLRADTPVSFSHDMTLTRTGFNAMVMAAIAYGLEGEDYTVQSALTFLKQLYDRGLLTEKSADTPIVICLDYEGIRWMEGRPQARLVIPEEGTLSYTAGLLSAAPVELPCGHCTCALRGHSGDTDPRYPARENYAPAVPVEDMAHFLTQTEDVTRQFQREVMGIRYHTSADHREHTLAAEVLLIAVLFWVVMVLYRTLRRDVRFLAVVLSCLVVGWILLRLFKWQLPTLSPLNRLCWYSFYLFQLPIPCVMLWLGLVIDRPSQSSIRPPRVIALLFALYAVIMAVIYTNDLHRLVWQFDLSGDWNNEYTYGPLFYLITVYHYGVLFASIVIMFHKSLSVPRLRSRILVLLASTLMAVYTAAYVAGIPFARHGDMTLTTCCIVLLFFEAAMRTGMVPVNSRYKELFLEAPLKMQLLDPEANAVLRSPDSTPITPALWEKLRHADGRAVELDQDTLLYATPIRGGTVVWEEDISSLNLLRRDMERSVQTLSTANRLLQQEETVRRRMLQNRIGTEIFHAMEQELEEKTGLLSRMVNSLPQTDDRPLLCARIILLLCHIKRRGNLFFMAYEGELLAGQDLSSYIDELSELVGYRGTRAMAGCGLRSPLDPRRAALFYDIFYEALDWALASGLGTVLTMLSEAPHGIEFRLMSDRGAGLWEPSPALSRAIRAAGGAVTVKDLEESVGVTVLFPAEKGVAV